MPAAGRFADFCTGGLSPGRIRIGNLCLSACRSSCSPTRPDGQAIAADTSSNMPVRVGQQRLRLSLGKLCPLFTFSTRPPAIREAFQTARQCGRGPRVENTALLASGMGNTVTASGPRRRLRSSAHVRGAGGWVKKFAKCASDRPRRCRSCGNFCNTEHDDAKKAGRPAFFG